MSIHRRGVMAAGAAFLASGDAFAQGRKQYLPPTRPKAMFPDGPMAQNLLGQAFHLPDRPVEFPANYNLRMLGGKRTTLEAYRGKVLLVSLWAEWCPPCLLELNGFAALKSQVPDERFEILPILTLSRGFRRPEDATRLLEKLSADKLPRLMDGRGGWLGERLTRTAAEPRGALPFNMIIDGTGVVRGVQQGGPIFKQDDNEYSAYSTNHAVSFAKALSGGILG